jgi:hypothetical protein
MNQAFFKPHELPIAQFERLGLAKNGQLLLSEEEQRILLTGRRTEMKQFQDLSAEGIQIPQIDAKLSMIRNKDGIAELRLHPIYKEPDYPTELTDIEAEKLINGELNSIHRVIKKTGQPKQDLLFEFDPETREFIKTDTKSLKLPKKVNDEELTAAQKEKLREGKEVELKDGTKFKYTGIDSKPFRANKYALIASILFDGGISYLLYKGIRSLAGAKQEEKNQAYSQGYQKAFEDMKQMTGQSKETPLKTTDEPMRPAQQKDEDQRTYTRSGVSR